MERKQVFVLEMLHLIDSAVSGSAGRNYGLSWAAGQEDCWETPAAPGQRM